MPRTDLDPLPHLRAASEPPGGGFARAVQPVAATAVATGRAGLAAGWLRAHGAA